MEVPPFCCLRMEDCRWRSVTLRKPMPFPKPQPKPAPPRPIGIGAPASSITSRKAQTSAARPNMLESKLAGFTACAARSLSLPANGRSRSPKVTRTGAEWVRMIADRHPEARIALVSSSLAEARAVMVEGESGIMAVCRPDHQPRYEPSLHRIRFRNGAQAQLFSAAEPESLRGPQHSHARWAGAEGILCQSGACYP